MLNPNSLETTLNDLQKILKEKGGNPPLHVNMSNLYCALREYDNAILHLHQALKLDPFYPEAYNNLGRIYFLQGLIQEARPLFEKALRMNKDYWEAHYNLAHSLAKQNQMQQATVHYQEVVRLHPTHPIAHFNLGLCYVEQENHTLAITHLKKAFELDPHNVEAIRQLGNTYLNSGQTDLAIQAFETTLELNEDFADVHHNLAILYLREQNRDKALSGFKEALKRNPENITAKHMSLALQEKSCHTAPTEYITQLFDQYAEHYDDHVKNQLKYAVPGLMRCAVGPHLPPNPKAGRVLDLGCGTGLCGIYFRDLALELIGVDLSPNMIERAKRLDTYEQLLVSDMILYLQDTALAPFDIIMAGDVLVYLGDLSLLFELISQRLDKQGQFVFTTEYLATGNYKLEPTGRFSHAPEYIQALAEKNHFKVVAIEAILPREQAGEPIVGRLYVLKR